jgi:hypothetical protein
MRLVFSTILFLFIISIGIVHAQPRPSNPWLTISPGKGPGNGKTVVLIAGDEEYRSEESLPQLARILAKRHGFKCIVLFAVDPKDGRVCPNVNTNILGLENLKSADLMIMLIRWRNLPDNQMKYIVDYAESGKPMIGMRTATHPFNLSSSSYRKYSWDNKSPDYEGGFGQQVFGETWIAHHGIHGKEGTRGVLASGQEGNPILKGITPGAIFSTTDVYEVRLPLPGDSLPLVYGQVLETLDPNAKPIEGAKNSPMMPIAWTRTYKGAEGKSSRIFTTTMGCSRDLLSDGFRRLMVNAVYWTLGMEKRIQPKAKVDIVGEYNPSPFEFRAMERWKPGKLPSEM